MIYYIGEFRWKKEHFNKINKHPVIAQEQENLIDRNIILNVHYIRTFKSKYKKEYDSYLETLKDLFPEKTRYLEV